MMIAARVGYRNLLIGIAVLAALPAFRPVAEEEIVERIVIRGNTHTRDKVIRREIGIAESQPFDVADLANVRRRIYAVGFFLIVAVSAQPGSSRGLVTLDIAVVEQPRAPVAGFSSVENFIAEARITQR
jgi:outer membrane protein insertion porin family